MPRRVVRLHVVRARSVPVVHLFGRSYRVTGRWLISLLAMSRRLRKTRSENEDIVTVRGGRPLL
ncbi:hypothetical protein [Sulfobacillus harzensis]|uniref:Uncharacterized protein n=1 Tax=Sulfobacillus harzensis TaxID=2729629 RepID=A0A7Y0Q1U6_9FIRM|nr:hypothetical protein [Sulfobacillus harzensis]NMP21211.1 hypothetical protein [Sulfobacillus harzensis]